MNAEDEKKLSDEEIRAYWTPERMTAAKPRVWTPATPPKPDTEPVPPRGEPKAIPGYDPTQSAEASKIGSPLVATPVPNPAEAPWLLADGTHPYGDWTVVDEPSRAIAMPDWITTNEDQAYDVGLLRYPQGTGINTGRQIGKVVGALPWMFNQPIGAETDWLEVAYPGSGHPGCLKNALPF
jgi:hypothetical protein